MKPLKYDWFGAIYRLRHEPQPHPYYRVVDTLNFADWFIAKWADWAEYAGMQPAHLLRYPGGLAWRVAGVWERGAWDVLCFPRKGFLCADTSDPELSLVYQFHKDGSVTLVTGASRADILGAQTALTAQDPWWIQSHRIQKAADHGA